MGGKPGRGSPLEALTVTAVRSEWQSLKDPMHRWPAQGRGVGRPLLGAQHSLAERPSLMSLEPAGRGAARTPSPHLAFLEDDAKGEVQALSGPLVPQWGLPSFSGPV